MSLKIILFCLITFLNCQNLPRRNFNWKKLQEFAKCVLDKKDLDNKLIELMQTLALSYITSTPPNYQEIINKLTVNFEKIQDCLNKNGIPLLPDGRKIIDLNAIYQDRYNWQKFLSCLYNKAKNFDTGPIEQLIKYINEQKFYNALREEFKLRNNGNIIVKNCMNEKVKLFFKENFNKTLDNI